jgi:hypothetical protein
MTGGRLAGTPCASPEKRESEKVASKRARGVATARRPGWVPLPSGWSESGRLGRAVRPSGEQASLDATERAVVGKRSRGWNAVDQTKLECLLRLGQRRNRRPISCGFNVLRTTPDAHDQVEAIVRNG